MKQTVKKYINSLQNTMQDPLGIDSKLEDVCTPGIQICFIFPVTHKLSWPRREETEHVILERDE